MVEAGRCAGGGKGGGVPDKPHKAFGGGVFLGLQLVENEILDSHGLGWCR
jgi:hypothetical protein